MSPRKSSSEDGAGSTNNFASDGVGEVTKLFILPVTQDAENLSADTLEVSHPLVKVHNAITEATRAERPNSKHGNDKRNSVVMIEEEKTTWLRELGEESRRPRTG